MFCSRKGNGIPITCTATSQKWTGQPIHLAGSKNPLTLGMGNVNQAYINIVCYISMISMRQRMQYFSLQSMDVQKLLKQKYWQE